MVIGRVVGELVLAGGDDRLAGLEALGDLDQIALPAADLDEDLLRDELLALGRRAAAGRGGISRPALVALPRILGAARRRCFRAAAARCGVRPPAARVAPPAGAGCGRSSTT